MTGLATPWPEDDDRRAALEREYAELRPYESPQSCIWLDVSTGRLCGKPLAAGALLLCEAHREEGT